MLQDISIKHLCLRPRSKKDSVPWGIFNIVWKAKANDSNYNYALDMSTHLTKELGVVLTIPALDANNFEDGDWQWDKHDIRREVGFNPDNIAYYKPKFDVYVYFEYVAVTRPIVAIYQELVKLQKGESLNYRSTDDCIFFSHILTMHHYWD